MVSVIGVQNVFQLRLFFGQFVKICIGFGVGGIDFVETRLGIGNLAEAFFDISPDILGGIELGFLWQETDLDAGLRSRLAFELRIESGHDSQQRGFSGAVQTENADLGAGEKAQGNITQDEALGWHDLGHLVHGVNKLCHYIFYGFGRTAADYPLIVRISQAESVNESWQ